MIVALVQVTQISQFKNDLHYLKQNKEKAAQLHSELKEAEARYVSSRERVENIERNLQPIQDKLHQLNSRRDELYRMNTKIGQSP